MRVSLNTFAHILYHNIYWSKPITHRKFLR
nr:MAG TPA: hypothetical protein [Bacteriophage sp.]